MLSTTLLPALALALSLLPTALTTPIAQRSTLTAAQLQQIAPKSNSCAGAAHPSECATASQALPPILQSFTTYGISSPAEQAALISTMAFESADFKFQKNYFPGTPGQGTRNMQSAAFNLKYAKAIPALAGKIGAAQAAGANGVRDLLIGNEMWDFGSAAWFLSSQCEAGVRERLQKGGAKGFGVYLDCVGTTVSDARLLYWQRAAEALGVPAI